MSGQMCVSLKERQIAVVASNPFLVDQQETHHAPSPKGVSCGLNGLIIYVWVGLSQQSFDDDDDDDDDE